MPFRIRPLWLSRPVQRLPAQAARCSFTTTTARCSAAEPKVNPTNMWNAQAIYLTQNETNQAGSQPSLRVHRSTAQGPEGRAWKAAESFFGASPPSFLYSSGQLRTTPPNSAVPEIAVIGASNVGKSSFINALIAGDRLPGSKEKMARTSAKAGHTRTMNAYGVGPSIAEDPVLAREVRARLGVSGKEEVPRHSLVLVDTPGYGFRSQKEWGDGIIGFLEKRTMLRGIVVLVASEKERLSVFDREVLRMIAQLGKSILVVATKGDKLLKDATRKAKPARPSQESASAGEQASKEKAIKSAEEVHNAVRNRLLNIQKDAYRACRLAGGTSRLETQLFLTAADMNNFKDNMLPAPQGTNRGIPGVRAAILKLVGLGDISIGASKRQTTNEQDADQFVPAEKRADMSSPKAYGGETISFDDLERMFGGPKK